ncbi:hypothetical protein BE15_34945 [Sorangium cellulosum]|uniref:Uncharacterized protein n=1 Tax=Sorangium cellulosum TaxID=56 RepID=A0A150QNR3_SORCE|nr:hypothetical protein BE15_34945 [Sorangium cellulosum]
MPCDSIVISRDISVSPCASPPSSRIRASSHSSCSFSWSRYSRSWPSRPIRPGSAERPIFSTIES